jgi:hypothetical protein
VTPAPRINHQRISNRLHRVLDDHVIANRLGEIFVAPTDLILAPTTVVNLISFHYNRPGGHCDGARRRGRHSSYEILSPTTQRTDRVIKPSLCQMECLTAAIGSRPARSIRTCGRSLRHNCVAESQDEFVRRFSRV